MIAIESVLEKLLTYYDLDNMSQLAEKLGVSQPTISKWKSRGSIFPVKKICRDIGIYNEIFGNMNSAEATLYKVEDVKNGYTLTLDLTKEEIEKLEQIANGTGITPEQLTKLALFKNEYI